MHGLLKNFYIKTNNIKSAEMLSIPISTNLLSLPEKSVDEHHRYLQQSTSSSNLESSRKVPALDINVTRLKSHRKLNQSNISSRSRAHDRSKQKINMHIDENLLAHANFIRDTKPNEMFLLSPISKVSPASRRSKPSMVINKVSMLDELTPNYRQ